MSILPSRSNYNQPAAAVLGDLKKGDGKVRGEFIWMHLERVYAVAYVGVQDPDEACQISTDAFCQALGAVRTVNLKNLDLGIWDWLSQYVVDAVGEWHSRNSGPKPRAQAVDSSQDGSQNMDWETTVILGVQRVKRCLGSLPEEQQKVFLLRHQLGLNTDQIATVLNQPAENACNWLYRARVQVVKCLGRG